MTKTFSRDLPNDRCCCRDASWSFLPVKPWVKHIKEVRTRAHITMSQWGQKWKNIAKNNVSIYTQVVARLSQRLKSIFLKKNFFAPQDFSGLMLHWNFFLQKTLILCYEANIVCAFPKLYFFHNFAPLCSCTDVENVFLILLLVLLLLPIRPIFEKNASQKLYRISVVPT